MKTSENINEIAKALSIAQSEIKPASKDGANPHFKSKFSTLASVWECIRIPVTSQGLTIIQDMNTEDKTSVSITTRIIHTSGQWIEFGPLTIPVTKHDAQGVGSASSYGKRYALSAALGIVSSEDDDDAEGAVGRGKCTPAKEPIKSYAECMEPDPVKNMSAQQLLVLNGLSLQIKNGNKEKIDKWLQDTYKTKEYAQLPESCFETVCGAYNRCLKLQDDERKKNETN
jgi:hypothetical protein